MDQDSAAWEVRRLLRARPVASLATQLRPTTRTANRVISGFDAPNDAAWPYASLILTACSADARPLLLLSDLADHTKNLREDPRLALLFEQTEGYDDPLEGPRATILGTARQIDGNAEREVLLDRFLRRHPNAELYAGFKDFHLFRVEVERAHLVAGFGRIAWLEAAAFMPPAGEAAKLAAVERDIIDHMNQDHGDAVQLMAGQVFKQHRLEEQPAQPSEGWQLTGVDPDGADLRKGNKVLRLDFEKPAPYAESCRVELVRLTRQARRAAAE